jgi:ABC-2 type transport system permease protein
MAHGVPPPDSAGGLMETMRMYFKLLGISFRSRMQFRTDFIIGIVSVMILNVFSLAMIGVILNRFQSLAGWSIWEIVFLYSLWMLGHSLFSLLFWHMEDLDYYLTHGTFDMFMVRPLSPFLQFLASEINYTGVADVMVGIAGMVVSMSKMGAHWNGGQYVYLGVVILAGTLIEFGITLGMACIAFWTGRSSMSINTVMQVSFVIQRYPLDMYGTWFKVFATAVVPVAFINYYPARFLLGKIPAGDPWGWLSYASPVVALALLWLASRVWTRAVKQYSSSGG